jgi:type IV secretion system protein VirB8
MDDASPPADIAGIPEWRAPPVNDAALGAYYDEVRSFQHERARRFQRSARLAWGLFGAAMLANVAQGWSIATMLPLKQLVPLYLWVQRDGTVDSATSMSELPRTESEAVIRAAVWQYVRNRESYDFADARYRYDLVSLMSGGDVRDRYQKWFLATGAESDSPQIKVGKRGQIDASLISLSFVRPFVALVRWRRSLLIYGEEPSATTWTSTVGFAAVDKLPAAARLSDPGGVIVTNYSASEDSP